MLENNRDSITTYISIIAATLILLSIFIFARAIISIGAALIIISYLFSTKKSSSFLSKHKAFIPLLIAGILISINLTYLMIVNHNINLKDIFAFSNPLFIVLYICALYFFLSKDERYANYLLNVFLCVISVFAIIVTTIFIYKHLHGINFIVSNLYTNVSGGGYIQSMVGLTFPLSAVIIFIKAIKTESKISRSILIPVALIIIFDDIFVNQGRIGYFIELSVLFYYSFIFVKKFSYSDGKLNIIKSLLAMFSSILFILMLFGIAYNYSTTFHTRMTVMSKNFYSYVTSDPSIDNSEYLKHTSTGQRALFYSTSIKIFKEYPSVLLFGCGYKEGIKDVTECSRVLIKDSSKLENEPYVMQTGVEPHNEFINYVFKAGIGASVCFIMFFIMLFYEAKNLTYNNMVFMRLLVIGFVIGCLFEYFISSQMSVTIFATLVAIFLAKPLENKS